MQILSNAFTDKNHFVLLTSFTCLITLYNANPTPTITKMVL